MDKQLPNKHDNLMDAHESEKSKLANCEIVMDNIDI